MAAETRRYMISGRVQGVGFRYWTVGRARSLGLIGWVRNRSDGRVEVFAHGAAKQLNALQKDLQSGPNSAQVEAVTVEPVSEEEAQKAADFTSFKQIKTY